MYTHTHSRESTHMHMHTYAAPFLTAKHCCSLSSVADSALSNIGSILWHT